MVRVGFAIGGLGVVDVRLVVWGRLMGSLEMLLDSEDGGRRWLCLSRRQVTTICLKLCAATVDLH